MKNWYGFFTLLMGLWVLLSGCSPGVKEHTTHEHQTRTDGLGRKVLIPAQPIKFLGLTPAETEMLFALLPDSQVAAVTANCNFPPDKVATKKRIEIYPIDIESVLALRPDLVLSEEGMIGVDDVSKLEKLGISVYVFRFRKSADVLAAMDSIVAWSHTERRNQPLMDSLHAGLYTLENEAKATSSVPNVLAITYHDPIFAYGFDTWMTDKIRLGGGRNVLNEKLDKPYPVLQRETVLKLNPDVLFGGSFEKMDTSFFRLYPELKRINAYRNRRIFELTDDLASRPGPRLLEGIKEIKRFLDQR